MHRILLSRTGAGAPVAACLVGWLLAAAAASAQTAAGVIPYFEESGVVYILHADHRDGDRGWATFGGRREEGETPQETAAREFYEETCCLFRPEATLPRIREAPAVTQGSYVAYVVRIPYVPVHFFESRAPRAACSGPAYEERGPYAWIPLPEVLRAVAAADSGEATLNRDFLPRGTRNRLWLQAAVLVRMAAERGYFAPQPDARSDPGEP